MEILTTKIRHGTLNTNILCPELKTKLYRLFYHETLKTWYRLNKNNLPKISRFLNEKEKEKHLSRWWKIYNNVIKNTNKVYQHRCPCSISIIQYKQVISLPILFSNKYNASSQGVLLLNFASNLCYRLSNI